MDYSKFISGFKTRQEMALEFKCSTVTFWRRLKKHGIDLPERELISPMWQEKVYRLLGCPTNSEGQEQK